MSGDPLPFVIGAGLGRTSTHSLQAALLKLGYNKVFHMTELFEGAFSPDPFFELARTERANGRKNETLALLTAQAVIDAGYTAVTDYPTCLLYPEFLQLTAAQGKVVLSVRSTAKDWKESVLKTIGIVHVPFSKPPFVFFPFFRNFAGTLAPWTWERTGGIAKLGEMDFCHGETMLDYADIMEAAYDQWVESVKQNVPAEKLLIHHPRDGYPPLCNFLGIHPCPEDDYPYISDTAEFQQIIASFEIVTMIFWPVVVFLVLLVGWVAKRCLFAKKKDATTKKKD